MKARPGKKLHPTGQLSIFAILIFQVLFILFAMSLNIALVVHDKINLQNSVDIAAYYGAMKQAEMMNAIAHINYQIRQSWKLLTWRYRVLGSVSITDQPAWNLPATNSDTEHLLPTHNHTTPSGSYFFCVGHKYWGGFHDSPSNTITTNTDLLCTGMGTTIAAPTVPTVSGVLGRFSNILQGIQNTVTTVGTTLRRKCNFYGYNSWLLGIMSFIHFRRDQSARKYMIHELAKALTNGKDLDNQLIETGVKKTFTKNLSFINKASFNKSTSKLKQFSSLDGATPGQWLRDQPFHDMGLYSNFYGSGGCTKRLDFLHTPPASVANQPNTISLTNEIGIHDPWPACAASKQCQASAGMRKVEDFIVFYSVKAELDYEKQIFLPFSENITLKAKAFAKPFGGLIGPDNSVDRLLPLPNLPGSTGPINLMDVDKRHSPNYSRYPGDPWGLRSSLVHYHWAKYIKSYKHDNSLHSYLKIEYPNDNDPLARNPLPGYPPGITARRWELAAVAPDLFDITYFTILPYYTEAYFSKIQNLIPNHNYLRGDFGMYRESNQFSGTSILYQAGYGSDPSKNVWRAIQTILHPNHPNPSIYSFFTKPFYKIQNLNMLLTGWNPPKQKYKPGDNDYEATSGNTNFGKCFLWAHTAGIDITTGSTRGKIANGCIYGGRTGYSVKMVSAEFLKGFSSAINPFPTGDPEWY